MRQTWPSASIPACIEPLEVRRLWTAAAASATPADVSAATPGVVITTDPLLPDKSALLITGTDVGDGIFLVGRPHNQIEILLDGTSQGTFNKPTGHLIVNGLGGDDTINLSGPSLPKGAIVDAGDGDDIVIGTNGNDIIRGGAGVNFIDGGKGNDVLVGGDEQDIIKGGNGLDILIGGNGPDALLGGDGDDLLIAGPTAYDADTPANNAALSDLLATWQTKKLNYDHSFSAVTSSKGVGNSRAHLTSETVSDDNDVDVLNGNAGTDAFILSRKDSGFPVDTLKDRSGDEIVLDLHP